MACLGSTSTFTGRSIGAVDMWAVGATVGEMVSREPLFGGAGNHNVCGTCIGQLHAIFRALGTPSETGELHTCWVGVSSLPHYSDHFPKWPARTPAQHLTRKGDDATEPLLPQDGQALLGQLLEYAPEKRLSAEEAIEHPYFS